ncbi:hypothetical protein DSECCO2_416760 [anaerobic digester metagenome]
MITAHLLTRPGTWDMWQYSERRRQNPAKKGVAEFVSVNKPENWDMWQYSAKRLAK